MGLVDTYEFDRHLSNAELTDWMHEVAATWPDLVSLESYGKSFEGRDLWLVTVTNTATGSHDHKPAHWVDASIHAVELTATVAACHLIHHLVSGFDAVDPEVTDALATRTFYVVPRVNPDGAEWVLADRPRHPRSSVRSWPWRDGHEWPGLLAEDIDGDGRILQMRIPDPDGAWMAHPQAAELMIPVPPDGAVPETSRYRLLSEGRITEYDGFTVPTPTRPQGLDLNRNFPAGWGTKVPGSGDHPLSEPEIDALVRAIIARPNICGYNAYHTMGAVLLRPSSTEPDAKLPPGDVWVWKQLAETGTGLTGYPAHSVFEDFTWDTTETMSGAADDWAYEHLGVFGWTTEFWDVVHAATGTKMSTLFWYTGPTDDEALAVLRWCEQHHPDGHVAWRSFDHPQLGPVELGGWDDLAVWVNPPAHRLRAEVAGHAAFAVFQARCSPLLKIRQAQAVSLGNDHWRIEVGISNIGWLPTYISARARHQQLTKPVTAQIRAQDHDRPVSVVAGPARVQLGQLEGRAALRFAGGNDGTPDRVLATWTVSAPAGTEIEVCAQHDRAGEDRVTITLG